MNAHDPKQIQEWQARTKEHFDFLVSLYVETERVFETVSKGFKDLGYPKQDREYAVRTQEPAEHFVYFRALVAIQRAHDAKRSDPLRHPFFAVDFHRYDDSKGPVLLFGAMTAEIEAFENGAWKWALFSASGYSQDQWYEVERQKQPYRAQAIPSGQKSGMIAFRMPSVEWYELPFAILQDPEVLSGIVRAACDMTAGSESPAISQAQRWLKT